MNKSNPENPDISEEDSRLFRESIGDVSLHYNEQIFQTNTPPLAVPRQRIKDEQSVIRELMDQNPELSELEYGAELSFHRPGIQQKVLRKLRKGEYKIEKELDLHGMTSIQAKKALRQFIEHLRDGRRHCVRIIHGKGRGSKDNIPVLKNNLNVWLRQFDGILAFCSAKVTDGGTGAVYVLIK